MFDKPLTFGERFKDKFEYHKDNFCRLLYHLRKPALAVAIVLGVFTLISLLPIIIFFKLIFGSKK